MDAFSGAQPVLSGVGDTDVPPACLCTLSQATAAAPAAKISLQFVGGITLVRVWAWDLKQDPIWNFHLSWGILGDWGEYSREWIKGEPLSSIFPGAPVSAPPMRTSFPPFLVKVSLRYQVQHPASSPSVASGLCSTEKQVSGATQETERLDSTPEPLSWQDAEMGFVNAAQVLVLSMCHGVPICCAHSSGGHR